MLNRLLPGPLKTRNTNESGVPIGTVIDYAGATPPTGYLACDGAAVSRTTYSALFTAIGTTWGAGDGSTTFNVPDLRGRAAIGSGTGSGLTARALGDTGGEEAHALTAAENGPHSHTIDTQTLAVNEGPTVGGVLNASHTATDTTRSSGSGDPHNNMQPFAVVSKSIRAL